jgi:magnesium-transporting ATPase (P-type)
MVLLTAVIVKQGEMQGVVIATGVNTFFGRTAKLVASAGAISHAQKAMFEIGNFLIIVAVGAGADHGCRPGLHRHRHQR